LTEKVRLATAGDREAFGELVLRYERLVLGIAWNRLRDYQAAQDVAQEAFITAFRRLKGLKDPAAFGAWIAQITVRCCHQARRVRPLVSLPAIQVHAGAPAESLIISEEADRVLTAIQTLPEHERSVVLLRYIEGYDSMTIARLTGCPLGTVTKQLSRAIQRLKDLLVEVDQ
jgi:RNA polymerase sigma-70 factor (ECF subfamily)